MTVVSLFSALLNTVSRSFHLGCISASFILPLSFVCCQDKHFYRSHQSNNKEKIQNAKGMKKKRSGNERQNVHFPNGMLYRSLFYNKASDRYLSQANASIKLLDMQFLTLGLFQSLLYSRCSKFLGSRAFGSLLHA